MLHSMLTKR
jgi:multidrug resistance protein